MELSTDYEFLAAALTAVTGDLFLSTLVPGPNTIIPRPYSPNYLWSGRWRDPEPTISPCKLHAVSERTHTWFCPIESEKREEKPLNLKTLTGKSIKIFIDRSSLVGTLKLKIQDVEGIPADQQRLITGGKQMEDWRRISEYEVEDDTFIHLVLRLGGARPSASLLDPKMFDSSKNCDFTWLQDDGPTYKRGNHVYKMPFGWNRIALNVKDKYDDNKWFGDDPGPDNFRVSGLKDEWPVAYHGKAKLFHKILLTVEANQGTKRNLEKGFYTSPDPLVAEESAPVFTFKSRKFKVMIQSRVNMNDTSVVCYKKFYATGNPDNIRPCGLLIKHV